MKPSVWTNIAYPIAGWMHSVELGIAFTLLGIASAGYHYTGKYWWQKADEIGMHLAFMTLIWLGIGAGLWQGILLGLAVVGTAILHRQFDNSYVGVLAIVAVAVSSSWIALPMYGVAMFFKVLEWRNIGSYEVVHSCWHIATAIAMYLTVPFL